MSLDIFVCMGDTVVNNTIVPLHLVPEKNSDLYGGARYK